MENPSLQSTDPSVRLADRSPARLSELPRAPGRLPFLGHALSLLRRPAAFLQSLRDVGPIVRIEIGKYPVYMITRPEMVHRILITEGRKVQRGGVFFEQVRADLFTQDAMGTTEGGFHLKRRKLMQPSFHPNHIGAYLDMMVKHTQALSDSWKDGQTVEVDKALTDVIAKNTAASMFGMDLTPELGATVCRIMPVLTDNFMQRMQIPKALKRLPLPTIRRFDGAMRDLRKLTADVVAERQRRGEGGGDLLGILLTTPDEKTGQPLSLPEVYDEVMSSLFAGIVTAASVMSWLFYELERFPAVQDRVLQEIRMVCGGNLSLGEVLPKLEYSRRVVHEVLRMHPILMFVRQVVETIEVGGVELPAGTDIGYSPYTLHHDPAVYPDSTRLDPDRWLPERSSSFPAGAFIPFGEGRHRCIGEHFAWAEILIALVTLLPRWKMRLAPNQDVREVNGVHPRPNGLRMIVQTR
jgi:cytochrome P450